MERYKVCTTHPRYFDTLQEAASYRNLIFNRTGDIVAVVAVKPRKKPSQPPEPVHAGMGSKIRAWYHASYPTDDAWSRIDGDVTFGDLFDALDFHIDVYKTIGVTDSVIRERCFAELAEITRMSYDEIYRQWIDG